MDEAILTPLQLWQNYNPDARPLKLAFSEFSDEGDCYRFAAYFDGDAYVDGSTRIYAYGKIPKGRTKATLLFVKDAGASPLEAFDKTLSEKDVALIGYDYFGESDAKNFTRYPESISYANLSKAGSHLREATPSAKETSLFIWCKVVRRVITFIRSLNAAPIVLIGADDACNIVWQSAAMDKRVDAVVPLLNAGWGGINNPNAAREADNERSRWFAACAPQSYARFITCPVMFAGATNSDVTPFDYVERTLKSTACSQYDRMIFCAGLSDYVNDSAIRTVERWLDAFCEKRALAASPELEISEENGDLILEASCDKSEDVNEIAVYYCFDEHDATLRNWNKLILSNASVKCALPVYDKNSVLHAFVNVSYKAGYTLSGFPKTVQLSQYKLKRTPVRKTHIIYERKNGTASFIVEGLADFKSNTEPIISSGAQDILGITVEGGNLSTYSVGDDAFFNDDQSLLQFDAFCQDARTLTIALTCEDGGIKSIYRAQCTLKGGEWVKMSLERQLFKSCDMLPLKSWKNVKKLTFENAGGVVFNNLLWV